MNPMIRSRTVTHAVLILVALSWIWVAPKTRAITPPPDGCYPGFTTAEGCNALRAFTSGVGNTGLGWESLHAVTTGSYNTAVGAGALVLNTGDSNTAVGTVALLLNTTGTQNTAVGTDALVYNDSGNYNTAVGYIALQSNTRGVQNCALGWGALHSNTDAMNNTAVGVNALGANNGNLNTAVGYHALYNNSIGVGNTAVGDGALNNNTTADDNIAIGNGAGANLTDGSGNIDIGNEGVAGEGSTIRIGDSGQLATYIAGIAGQTVGAGGTTCYVDNDGKLGVFLSARRYKENIERMGDASAALFSLNPVTFRYKPEFDKSGTPQFGLIAEEVAEVSPKLVTHNARGELTTVRYEAINAMLLNEFLKEHRKVQEQETTIAQLKKDMENVLARLKQHDSTIQQVSDQIKVTASKSRVVSE